MSISGATIIERLDALARFTEAPGMLTRTYLTAQHRAAGEQLAAWMREAGMQAGIDAAGNVVGRYEATEPGRPALITGSHFDTVRDAGRYDGMYGIVAAIACVEALHMRGERLPFAIEVIGFADEEGVRFNATLLGSRAVAGTFDTSVLARTDGAGCTMAEAMREYGLDPARVVDAARRSEQVLAFVETHIEQGPVLLEEDLPVGVVTAIAGATRFDVAVSGCAGHAGTVPMGLRRDAAAAAAEALLYVERRCSQEPGLVGTVGRLEVPNGATNVIAGRAAFSLDVRSGDDAVRQAAVRDILARLVELGERRGVTFDAIKTHEAPAAGCAPWLMEQLDAAVARAGTEPRRLLSGAGHDAMALAALTDIAMLFVRCGAGGVSHHPDETMTIDDAGHGATVLLDFIRHFIPVDAP